MERLERYIHEMSSPEDALMEELTRTTNQRAVHPQMLSGHIQGRFLGMLVRMLRPHRVLEIGTFTGYSALSMAGGRSDTRYDRSGRRTGGADTFVRGAQRIR